MKEAIKLAVKYMVLAIIGTALILAVFTLFLAMPDILRWVSSYIGEFMTWVVFIFIIGAVIILCRAE